MKKLVFLLLGLVLLSGCGKGDNYSTFMVKDRFDNYNLFDNTGDQLSDLNFKSYIENDRNGYVVVNENDQQGYINYEGDMVVDYGEYDRLSFADSMIIGTKVKEEKQGEETVKSDIYYVLDDEGKALYVSSADVNVKIDALPIVTKDGVHQVLHRNGETLYTDQHEVLYTLFDNKNDIYVVATEMFTDLFYYLEEEMKTVNLPVVGKYVISDVNSSGVLLYDKSLKSVVYVDLTDASSHVFKDITANKIYFDDNKNIVVEYDYNTYLLTLDADKPKLMNTYYMNSNTYVYRSTDVYGPHSVYLDKKMTANLTGCQIFPSAYKIQGNYFPVYMRDGGYQFYGFDGKQPFTTSFFDADAFDKNGRAIVRDGAALCYLINESGLSVTKNYFNIKYISGDYYAAYNKDGNFGIIDKNGNVILPMGYTTLPDHSVFHYGGKEYIMVEKYGRTYVYSTSEEYKEVFSVEGNTIFDDRGYFIVDDSVYYTFDGEIID